MAGLVELGGVEGEAEAEGGAGVELGAVGERGDAAVVDLDLLFVCSQCLALDESCWKNDCLPWRR